MMPPEKSRPATQKCAKGCLCLVGCLSFSLDVRAGKPANTTIPVSIQYQADPACPDKSAFLSALWRRSRKIREAFPGESAPDLLVHLEQRSSGVRGEISLEDDSGTQSRVVYGNDCEEAMEVLALTTAVGLDPTFSQPPEPEVPESSPAEVSVPVPSPPPRPTPTRAQWDRAASLMFSGHNLVAPVLLGGASLGFGASREGSTLRPSIWLRVEYARSDWLSSDAALTADWVAAQIESCFIRAPLESWFTLDVCARGTIGIVGIEPLGVANSHDAQRAAYLLGVGLRPELLLSGSWSLQLHAGADRSLVRREFTVSLPEQQLAQTRNVMISLGAGIAHSF